MFYASGMCSRGALCRFYHAQLPMPPAAMPPPTAYVQVGPGPQFQPLQPVQPVQPVPASPDPAVTVCRFWLAGVCTRGRDCRFLHRALEAAGEAAPPAEAAEAAEGGRRGGE